MSREHGSWTLLIKVKIGKVIVEVFFFLNLEVEKAFKTAEMPKISLEI